MNLIKCLLVFFLILFVNSCKKGSSNEIYDYTTVDSIYNVVDTIDTNIQKPLPTKKLEFFPIEQTYKSEKKHYKKEDYVCPECGDEKEIDEELCYYCNKKLEEEKRTQKNKEDDENEDDEE